MGDVESTLTDLAENSTNNINSNNNNNNNNDSSTQHNTSRRRRMRRRLISNETSDEPTWWDIENDNLILDGVPNVTAEYHESESISTADFTNLLKIEENLNENLAKANENAATILIAANLASEPTTTTLEIATIKNELMPGIKSEVTMTPATMTETSTTSSDYRVQSLEEFKEELRVKRLARQTAVQDLRDEMNNLRKQLAKERELTQRLRRGEFVADDEATNVVADSEDKQTSVAVAAFDADDEDAKSRSRHANIELANVQLALQLANSENLSLKTEVSVVQKQVNTLKEVVSCCKQMMQVKEEQCNQLKEKLTEIENSFGEREMKIMSDNLRQEYERQLGNIRQLRELYDERQRVSAAEHENLQRLISIKRDELAAEKEKTKNFEERNQTLVKEVETANNELATLREECNEHKFEKKTLKDEMGAINTLFSQMVLGFNGKNNLDIDRLTMMLEENRTLLNDMATKEVNCSDGATLPKLLFELVEQAAVNSGDKVSDSNSAETLTEDEDDNASDVVAAAAMNDDSQAKQDEDKIDVEEANQFEAKTSTVLKQKKEQKQQQQRQHSQEHEKGENNVVDCATAESENLNISTNNNTNKNAKKHNRKNVHSSNGNCSYSKSTKMSTTFKLPEPEIIGKVASAQEIIGNLPKVWKVLMELLSHHKNEQVQFEENGKGEDCYKSVETPNGPKAELSVSKTYIKLKDLILEKKSLVKETNRLKTLNCHLDYRLNEQEKRLSTVSLELTKTWHLVGKMQRQHRQLHTQEQILRYQLQQKRRLLSELKDELEYCRRKWAVARAKNDESQEQCNELRREFAKRKLIDANNSAESGYSDSGPASDEDEQQRAALATGVVATNVVEMVVSNGVAQSVSASSGSSCRRRNLKQMFEHSRKIKRMQSTSPGRANAQNGTEIILRWNSAPPTCGWHRSEDDEEDEDEAAAINYTDDGDDDDDDDDDDNDNDNLGVEVEDLPPRLLSATMLDRGAIPKTVARNSRGKYRSDTNVKTKVMTLVANESSDGEQRDKRATRIMRLEEQCKSLIQQVLETSDNRERLEVQLCRFQDDIAPVQYAVPLNEFINKKRIERMTRASSAPVSGTLTPREEEYTRKRSERLERLEEESRQLMSRIKRTSDRGHYLRCSLDRIRRAPSREGSFESNTEEDSNKTENSLKATKEDEVNKCSEIDAVDEEKSVNSNSNSEKSPLTAVEEAYTARRAARLQRLEEESKQLISKLSKNAQRGGKIGNKLDALHERYSGEECATSTRANSVPKSTQDSTIEKRIENIEKISTNREERLRILEEEGNQLISRLSNTSERGTQMINRIAERELKRNERAGSAANSKSDDTISTPNDDVSLTEETPVAAALLPVLKNVACTSIVSEELAEHVTVTTIPSQIAAQQGAIPKTKPTAQLCAARRDPKYVSTKESTSNSCGGESLEEMVKRLKELPYPADDNQELDKQSIGEEREKETESAKEKQQSEKDEVVEWQQQQLENQSEKQEKNVIEVEALEEVAALEDVQVVEENLLPKVEEDECSWLVAERYLASVASEVANTNVAEASSIGEMQEVVVSQANEEQRNSVEHQE